MFAQRLGPVVPRSFVLAACRGGGGVTTMYIAVDGQITTNNGDWVTGTAWNVGGMFRLSVQ